jgi:Ca2+/Na+ antiporter
LLLYSLFINICWFILSITSIAYHHLHVLAILDKIAIVAVVTVGIFYYLKLISLHKTHYIIKTIPLLCFLFVIFAYFFSSINHLYVHIASIIGHSFIIFLFLFLIYMEKTQNRFVTKDGKQRTVYVKKNKKGTESHYIKQLIDGKYNYIKIKFHHKITGGWTLPAPALTFKTAPTDTGKARPATASVRASFKTAPTDTGKGTATARTDPSKKSSSKTRQAPAPTFDTARTFDTAQPVDTALTDTALTVDTDQPLEEGTLDVELFNRQETPVGKLEAKLSELESDPNLVTLNNILYELKTIKESLSAKIELIKETDKDNNILKLKYSKDDSLDQKQTKQILNRCEQRLQRIFINIIKLKLQTIQVENKIIQDLINLIDAIASRNYTTEQEAPTAVQQEAKAAFHFFRALKFFKEIYPDLNAYTKAQAGETAPAPEGETAPAPEGETLLRDILKLTLLYFIQDNSSFIQEYTTPITITGGSYHKSPLYGGSKYLMYGGTNTPPDTPTKSFFRIIFDCFKSYSKVNPSILEAAAEAAAKAAEAAAEAAAKAAEAAEAAAEAAAKAAAAAEAAEAAIAEQITNDTINALNAKQPQTYTKTIFEFFYNKIGLDMLDEIISHLDRDSILNLYHVGEQKDTLSAEGLLDLESIVKLTEFTYDPKIIYNPYYAKYCKKIDDDHTDSKCNERIYPMKYRDVLLPTPTIEEQKPWNELWNSKAPVLNLQESQFHLTNEAKVDINGVEKNAQYDIFLYKCHDLNIDERQPTTNVDVFITINGVVTQKFFVVRRFYAFPEDSTTQVNKDPHEYSVFLLQRCDFELRNSEYSYSKAQEADLSVIRKINEKNTNITYSPAPNTIKLSTDFLADLDVLECYYDVLYDNDNKVIEEGQEKLRKDLQYVLLLSHEDIIEILRPIIQKTYSTEITKIPHYARLLFMYKYIFKTNNGIYDITNTGIPSNIAEIPFLMRITKVKEEIKILKSLIDRIRILKFQTSISKDEVFSNRRKIYFLRKELEKNQVLLKNLGIVNIETANKIIENIKGNEAGGMIMKKRKNSFEAMTMKELKKRAMKKKIKGYSSMKKETLIHALRKHKNKKSAKM